MTPLSSREICSVAIHSSMINLMYIVFLKVVSTLLLPAVVMYTYYRRNVFVKYSESMKVNLMVSTLNTLKVYMKINAELILELRKKSYGHKMSWLLPLVLT